MAVDQELSATLERVAAAFETVAVPWAIGGSFASTLYGELTGRSSERQWRDVLSVIRLGGEIDLAYAREVARGAKLLDLLEAALAAIHG